MPPTYQGPGEPRSSQHVLQYLPFLFEIHFVQGHLLLTWLNRNANMDNKAYLQYSVGWNGSSIPKLQTNK